jgi:hypothetical protein
MSSCLLKWMSFCFMFAIWGSDICVERAKVIVTTGPIDRRKQKLLRVIQSV